MQKVVVTAYAGYRGEEEPRVFVLKGDKIEVLAIRKRWIQRDRAGTVTKRFFSIKGSDGYLHVLSCDDARGEWFLESG